jgi:hypothetical protein
MRNKSGSLILLRKQMNLLSTIIERQMILEHIVQMQPLIIIINTKMIKILEQVWTKNPAIVYQKIFM